MAVEALIADAGPVVETGRRSVRRVVEQIVGDALECLAPTLDDPERVAPGLATAVAVDLHRAVRPLWLRVELMEEASADPAWDVVTRFPSFVPTLVERVNRIARHQGEVLTRATADTGVLEAATGRRLGRVATLRSGLGDRHGGGRSVTAVGFEHDRWIYKPRSPALDVAFAELLGRLAARDAAFDLQAPEVLDRGAYGWVRPVAAAPCSSVEEIERFHFRQGLLCALLFALGGSDFHHENLMAVGEHPVVLDLEGLFHPQPRDCEGGTLSGWWGTVGGTVLSTGLLPRRGRAVEPEQVPDLSGFQRVAGQHLVHPYRVEEAATGRRLRQHRLPMGAGDNLPFLNGVQTRTQDHADAVVAGFEHGYRLLEGLREELVAPGGALSRFDGCETRVVLRPTRGYVKLLRNLAHPICLRDESARRSLLARLRDSGQGHPVLTAVAPEERREVEAGDVPRFTARVDSRDVTSGGGVVYRNLLKTSGAARARTQVGSLGADDRFRQRWLIEQSLALDGNRRGERRLEPAGKPAAVPGALEDRVRELVRRLGHRLCDLAILDHPDGLWLSAFPAAGRWHLQPVSLDLYGGASGIVWFLAHAAAVIGDERIETTARQAWEGLRRRLDETPSQSPPNGAFEGWAGPVYLQACLAGLWSEPSLTEAAEAWAARCSSRSDDKGLDLLAGDAGALAVLAVLHRQRPSERLLGWMRRLGHRLTAAAEADGSWRTLDGQPPPAGLGHGAAGIALALLRLYAATGDPEPLAAARRGVAFEDGLYSLELGNWRDIRSDRRRPAMTAWCHGAVGIGLARLAGSRWAQGVEGLEPGAVTRDVDRAVQAVAQTGLQGKACLCHGDAGTLELLINAHRAGHPRVGADLVDRYVAALATGIEVNELRPYGPPDGLEPLGLMLGTAGVGHALLRWLAPDRVPSILTLEAPEAPGVPLSPAECFRGGILETCQQGASHEEDPLRER